MEFLFWSAVCLSVFFGIAHIDSYFGYKQMMTEEQRKGFTFIWYTITELKRHFLGINPK